MGIIRRIYYLLKGYHLDTNGYWRDKFNQLIHRSIAYKKIYLESPEDYPLPFEKYVIHHINKDKQDNRVSNLKVETPYEHNYRHGHIYYSKINGKTLNTI